jgi:hypothetical protein
MVQAAEAEDRGVQIPDVNRILNGGETLFVGRTVGETAANAAAGHPPSEGAAVMVHVPRAASAHFTTPNHERLLQQAAPLEIGDQTCERSITGRPFGPGSSSDR